MKKTKSANSRPGLGILRLNLSNSDLPFHMMRSISGKLNPRPKRSQFNFTWLFAIIAGAMILILAIYGASRIGETQRYKSDTEVAKKISILTDPLQAGFAEGSYGRISFKQETRMNNICLADGFGKNDISISTKSRVGAEWLMAGGAISVHNKYIFSSLEQGKEFYVFSKPFDFPYEVSDLIFMTSGKYCFINAPENVQDEILGMNIANIEIENCSADSTEVCFDSGNCDVNVRGFCEKDCESVYDEGYVEKSNKKEYYIGSLIYGAIFSEEDIYECNVKRLFYRTMKIAGIYANKAELMTGRGCSSNLKPNLVSFASLLENAESSDLISLNQIAKDIEKINDKEVCGLW